jgi:hypothetical protein
MDRHHVPWGRGAMARVSAQVVCVCVCVFVLVQSWREPWRELVVSGVGGIGLPLSGY